MTSSLLISNEPEPMILEFCSNWQMDLVEFACPEDAIERNSQLKSKTCNKLGLDMLQCSWPECPSFNDTFYGSLIDSKAMLIYENGTDINSTVEVQCIEPGKDH